MYTKEEKERAIKLLIKYEMGYTAVIRDLGYPDRMSLYNWYAEYLRDGPDPDGNPQERKKPQKLGQHFLQQGQVRRLRKLVWAKGLAQQRRLPESHLAVQP